jgi:hypothetical protein
MATSEKFGYRYVGETEQARPWRRVPVQYVDLRDGTIDHDLFRSIPVI